MRSDALQVHEDGNAVLTGDLEFNGISLQDTLASLHDRITTLELALESILSEMTAPSND